MGGLDGIGHVIISVGIFVTGKESIGQAKIYFYYAPSMATFEYGGIETLYFITGTGWVVAE